MNSKQLAQGFSKEFKANILENMKIVDCSQKIKGRAQRNGSAKKSATGKMKKTSQVTATDASQWLGLPKDAEPVRPNSARSKLLNKFDHIKSLRSSNNSNELCDQIIQDQHFENIKIGKGKHQFDISRMTNNQSLQTPSNTFPKSNDICISKNYTPQAQKRQRKASMQNTRTTLSDISRFITFSKQDFMFVQQDRTKKEQKQYKQIIKILECYWNKENKFVYLIPLQKNQDIVFDHPNILPIYGQIILDTHRYIISDQYKSNLQNLLQEFGPFNEFLVKKYILKILKGLQEMHYHKVSHNRLNAKSILADKDGNLLINPIKSSNRPLNEKDKSKIIQLYAPDLLFQQGITKNYKNDVWALGCLAIQMLTSESITKSKYHPYNENYIGEMSPQDKLYIQTAKEYYPNHFDFGSKNKEEDIKYKVKNQQVNLSEASLNFIDQCLKIRSDQRPDLDTLTLHDFFNGA